MPNHATVSENNNTITVDLYGSKISMTYENPKDRDLILSFSNLLRDNPYREVQEISQSWMPKL